MDKSYIHDNSLNKEKYTRGVLNFLDFAFAKSSKDRKILCPCTKCVNCKWRSRMDVYEHIICNGFLKGYVTWIFHGEQGGSSNYYDDTNVNMENGDSRTFMNEPNVQQSEKGNNSYKLYQLLKEAEQKLYPGCKKFTKLSFIVHLYHLKCLNGWTDKSFTMLLELLSDALPEENTLPKSFYDTKKIISGLGLSYEKIHACPNDCIFYRRDLASAENCPKYKLSRWKHNSDDVECREKILAMILPDSFAWKDFDCQYPDFSCDPRNIRLGLASDGFNPFKTMKIPHSTWPIILIPYNLPLWMCMKQLIIPGPKGPGCNLDVYMKPLVEELKELWEVGVKTFDACKKESFQMHVAIIWTINDFPAYANLSGWSTKGQYACPCCGLETTSKWLYNSKSLTKVSLAICDLCEARVTGPVHYRWMYPIERYHYFFN
uniref:Uncharacterized protein n=1 Tax=Cajanus cajan TaxID=3821 RepID=A0A151UD49_CAJCA